MELKVKYNYKEGYLPTPRCRKLRFRTTEDEVRINIKEITEQQAPIAFIVTDLDMGTGEFTKKIEYRFYNNKLWAKVNWRDKHCNKEGLLPLSELRWYIRGVYDYWNHDKEKVIESYLDDAKDYLIIDGIVYEVIGEPRYVINTFGLGHNHGGTGMFVENHYNSNISKKRYFTALQREEAIKEANRIASNRGDTNDVGKFGEGYNIEVFIPEAVKCNPQKEHGDGDPFLNSLDSITESSSSVGEAGLLGMCLFANELNK